MKVGLAYTSTTPELIERVEYEVKKRLGDEVEIVSRQDPGILAEIRENGYVSAVSAARLIKMYAELAQEEVDAILNICSSVGRWRTPCRMQPDIWEFRLYGLMRKCAGRLCEKVSG